MSLLIRNEYLFSEVYLQEITRIEEQPEVVATLSIIKETLEYANANSIQEWNKSFLHQVLQMLRFSVEQENENVILLYPSGEKEKPLSVCYTLLPAEDLNNTLMGRNWSEKIIRQLRKLNLKWGILTNGHRWRIYHTEEPTPYENYLEFDLAQILEKEDTTSYQIFYHFMKADNFQIDGAGLCAFDVFKKESQKKIEYVEKELKKALQQEEEGGKGILSNLCMGYVEYLRASGTADFSDENLRDVIYGSAMLYMFRILFLFYAQARGLLSTQDEMLFLEVLETAKNSFETGQHDKTSYGMWEKFRIIFGNINFNYNGGLFNPEENDFTKFIEDHRIADHYLSRVLYYMSYYEDENKNIRPISYRDIGVRHLGTLYEGLLEYKLFVAEEDTAVQVYRKDIQFIPISEGGKITPGKYIPSGQVYFGSDKTKRKGSGSYYTPESIVDYIVSNTVGEKLKELKTEFLKSNEEIIQSLETATGEDERNRIIELYKNNLLEFLNKKILKLSVLDPAMGSGHFLVNATNQIANAITELMNEHGIETDLDTSTLYWRRRVVENCIYGVDFNPLAVELAKLSLWIITLAEDQPLSFMNHHFKCGNSLIGVRIEDIGNYPLQNRKNKDRLLPFEKGSTFAERIKEAINLYQEIELKETVKRYDVDEKIKFFQRLNKKLEPYKALFNYHTDVFFSGDISRSDYEATIESFDEHFEWNSKNYLHWELEFTEIFKNYNGFDVVIGNPPYGNLLSNTEINFIKKYYEYGLAKENNNLAALFIERSFSILNDNGYLSFIIPKSSVYVENWKGLREFLINKTDLLKFIDNGQSFENVLLEMVTFISKKSNKEKRDKIETGKLYVGKFQRFSTNENYYLSKRYFTNSKYLISINNCYVEDLYNTILNKSIFLGDISIIFRGLSINNKLTNNNENRDKVPILRGKSIKRYKIENHSFVDKNLVKGFQAGELVFQEIVAHIYTPLPHIKLIGAINYNKYPSVNTVTNIKLIPDGKFTKEFILGVLHSEIINWYVYKFIYINAFRTMHFSGNYTQYVPIPDMKDNDIEEITDVVDGIVNGKINPEIGQKIIDEKILEFYSSSEIPLSKINEILNEY